MQTQGCSLRAKKEADMHGDVLKNDIRYLKGFGPKRAGLLHTFGIYTVADMLTYFPLRYEDRAHFKKIADVRADEFVTITGRIIDCHVRPVQRIKICEAIVSDGTGSITAVWFNQPFLKNTLTRGAEIVLSGETEYYRGLQIKSPEYELTGDSDDETIHTGRIVPIYPLHEGLRQKSLRTTMFSLVTACADSVREYLPQDIIKRYDFLSIAETIRNAHFPETVALAERARTRIVYEEFLRFELGIAAQCKQYETYANHFRITDMAEIRNMFERELPFKLTHDQRAVLDDIATDYAGVSPMNRLVQGDVGSGKTLVACCALWCMVAHKHQTVFLIPTEILAEQHYQTIMQTLTAFDVTVAFLTGSTKKKDRAQILKGVASGEVDILIGTHALLEDDIAFHSLGLVVIDEQHKFGVMQRAKLLKQKKRPHLLVMTATPIPRTLGLTVYGDLTISCIRTMPKGRQAIRTYWISQQKREDMFVFLKKKIAAGEQVYFLFPLVEETEKMDLKAATEEYELLRKHEFAGMSVGLIHGRLKAVEKDTIMRQFKEGEIQVLVSTTVIEVGIDNPNATCMVIEHAERFGLSQLHQLRGRVGRGSKESFCFLLGTPKTEDGKKRLSIMTKTTDGFVIAEEDLKIRGVGDFLGTRQSGMPVFLIADIVAHDKILDAARHDAFTLSKQGDFSLRENIFFTRAEHIHAEYINN